MKENIYNNIFYNGHTPMLIIDSDTGEIKDGNPAACNYYGYTRDSLLKLKITDINILSPEEVFEEMRKARIEERKIFRFKHKLSNNEIKEVEVYSGPLSDGGGSLLFSIIHDVEDKKKMEHNLRQQESYFKSLYENSPEAIAILDNEFRVININSSFERIFQYCIDEIRNKNITDVLCEKKSYDESTYLKDSITKGEFVRKEILRRRKDGKLVEISFLGYPIMSNGQQIGVYALYSDLSKIKEDKREQEKRIQMYIDMLKNAKIKAEEASKFKTQFIANMTHEIRTPMNGIVGIIELLEDIQMSEEQKEYFYMLRYSANRLSSIINDVMDISKIEAGKLELRNIRFNIKKLLDDAAGYYKVQAGRKGLDLSCSIDPGLPNFVIGDPDKLNQILFNLLSNAVKFTETGHIDIEVRIVGRDENNASIKFSISDTGIGIPNERIDDIFKDFYQLETIKNKKYSGTGLGLSISKKLIQLMGSNIAVEAEYGKGSTFYFIVAFPVPQLQEDSENNCKYSTKHSLCMPSELNILVTEDDEINQKIIKSLLERNKCNVTIAANGKEALKILDKRSFDVILMDIYMPELNGFETARLIRKNEALAGRYTPIIALTAAVENEDREEYISAEIDACIAKPCEREQIYGKISEVLRNKCKAKVLNIESLVERLGGDYELLNEIIEEVVSSEYEKKLFGGIEDCIKEKDLERLSCHIHKYKGSISHFQAYAIDEIMSEIKRKCRDRDFSDIEKLYDKLKIEYLSLPFAGI